MTNNACMPTFKLFESISKKCPGLYCKQTPDKQKITTGHLVIKEHSNAYLECTRQGIFYILGLSVFCQIVDRGTTKLPLSMLC